MKNKMGYLLREAKKHGVKDGIDFALGIAFLALNNIIDEYIEDEETIGKFARHLEKEVNEIYGEVMKSVPSGEIDEMAEKIVYHVERLRRKWSMDES